MYNETIKKKQEKMRKQKKVTYAENIVNTEIRIAEIQMNRDPTMFNVITDRTPNT